MPNRLIIPLSLLSTILLIGSVTIPRLFQGTDGFAGATSAAMTFLGLFVLGLILGVYVLVVGLRAFGGLDLVRRLATVMPMIIVVGILVWFGLQFSS